MGDLTYRDANLIFDERKGGEFLDEFQRESDRAAAILAGAYLDESLRRVLLKAIAPELGLAKALLGPDRPLGTFSARTSVCAAFGLIGKEEHHDLQQIRKIRNKFAHGLPGLTFVSEGIPHLVSALAIPPMLRGLAPFDPSNPRETFLMSVAMLSTLLARREVLAEPRSLPPHQWKESRLDND